MTLLDIVKPEVEVCVIGAGAGGPALGKHLSDAGVGVVILEAGRKYDPNTDYSDLPAEMILLKFGFYRERRAQPFMLEFDANGNLVDGPLGAPLQVLIYVDQNNAPIYFDVNNPPYPAYFAGFDGNGNPQFINANGDPTAPLLDPLGNPVPYFVYLHGLDGVVEDSLTLLPVPKKFPGEQDDATPFPVPNKFGYLLTSMGVGGTTLQYYGNHPRAHYYALDHWDSQYGEHAQLPNGAIWREELETYFEKLEKDLPVPNAPMGYGPFDTHNAMTLVGAANYAGLNPSDPDYASVPLSIPMFDANQYDATYTPYEQVDLGGYRGQPNNMTTNCWHCGLCQFGCHKPEEGQLKDKVKRATNVSFIPEGEKNGMEVRPQSVAIAVLRPSSTNLQLGDLVGVLPNLVVYGTYSLGPDGLPQRDSLGTVIIDHVWVQPAHVVVFAAGTTESPRLWMQSNWLLSNDAVFYGTVQQLMGEYQTTLPTGIDELLGENGLFKLYVHPEGNGQYSLPNNQHVGQNFMTHVENIVYGIYNKPIEIWVGQNSQARVDIPPLGMIEAIGGPSPHMTSFIAFAKDIRIDPQSGFPVPDPVYNGPYDMPIVKFGVEAKNLVMPPDPQTKVGGWRYGKIAGAFAEDDPLPTNKIYLDPTKKERYYVPSLEMNIKVPVLGIQYHPSAAAKERSRKLTKVALQMFLDVEKATPAEGVKLLRDQYDRPMLYNLNFEADPIFHSMGTMGMGKVVNSDCEAIDEQGNVVNRIFVADSCVFPNTLGGPNPVHTIQAMAFRTAEAIGRKYLLSNYTWRKWKEKVGTDNFWF